MNIGILGLGKMGLSIAIRLQQLGYNVRGFDTSSTQQKIAQQEHIHVISSIEMFSESLDILWLMVPAGDIVDQCLEMTIPHLKKSCIIVDGGNSYFKDSQRRYKMLSQRGFSFIDCGTSGGIHGKDIGYSLMIGGDRESFEQIEPIFKAIAAPNGYGYMGASGSGHYVKMVHNGIEYALLQAYAEGLHLLKEGSYQDLDLALITRIWNNGSIIRSWICELAHNILQRDQDLKTIGGAIQENKTGFWTLLEAQNHQVPVLLLEDALKIRTWSRETGGNYGTKLVALLRNEFGGHPITLVDKEKNG